MRAMPAIAAAVAVVITSLGAAPAQPAKKALRPGRGKHVPIVVSWSGKVKLSQRSDAPEGGCVADREGWEKLWKAWRPGEALPSVDFDEAIVLVTVGDDPNSVGAVPTVDERGDLRVMTRSTAMYFKSPKTCSYQFALIMRSSFKAYGDVKGTKKVGGKGG